MSKPISRRRFMAATAAAGLSQIVPRRVLGGGGQGGHERDWIRACKDGRPASSNFEYGAALTEMVLLGVLALRVKDRKLHWDAVSYSFRNDPAANALLQSPCRDGWSL